MLNAPFVSHYSVLWLEASLASSEIKISLWNYFAWIIVLFVFDSNFNAVN